MKFNCGPYSYTRWLNKRLWHLWFAWRPVRVAEGDCRWLEFVERRDANTLDPSICIMGMPHRYWEYRAAS